MANRRFGVGCLRNLRLKVLSLCSWNWSIFLCYTSKGAFKCACSPVWASGLQDLTQSPASLCGPGTAPVNHGAPPAVNHREWSRSPGLASSSLWQDELSLASEEDKHASLEANNEAECESLKVRNGIRSFQGDSGIHQAHISVSSGVQECFQEVFVF